MWEIRVFGTFWPPLVTPWDNRGKCYMDRKRIQCLSNASQHVRIYIAYILNRFPVIQLVSSNVYLFSTFLHILASPGHAPGTIGVNVTRLERGFNACKMLRYIYPFIFNHFWDIGYSDISVTSIGRKLRHFHTHLCLAAPQGVTPSKFREDVDIHKTRLNGLSCGEESMTICSAVLIQYQRVTDVDRRTDGQTDRIGIAKTCFSIADARKNAHFFWDTVYSRI